MNDTFLFLCFSAYGLFMAGSTRPPILETILDEWTIHKKLKTVEGISSLINIKQYTSMSSYYYNDAYDSLLEDDITCDWKRYLLI